MSFLLHIHIQIPTVRPVASLKFLNVIAAAESILTSMIS